MFISVPAVQDRIFKLLDDAPGEPEFVDGYLDLLGPADGGRARPGLAQSAMQSTLLPKVYEGLWRPVGFNVAKGWPFGPSTAQEFAQIREWLGLGQPGDPDAARPAATVLDVACGPGNVTRALRAGMREDGLVVGMDMSASMLARAVADTADADVGYVRGDAANLPFRDGSFDAVCCIGGMYLFDDPWAALNSMTRVLKPGGRIVILTSRRPRLPLAGMAGQVAGRAIGMTMFRHDEVTCGLTTRGYENLKRHSYPLMQMVGARLA